VLGVGVLFAEFRKAFEGIGKYVPRVLRMPPSRWAWRVSERAVRLSSSEWVTVPLEAKDAVAGFVPKACLQAYFLLR